MSVSLFLGGGAEVGWTRKLCYFMLCYLFFSYLILSYLIYVGYFVLLGGGG